MNRNHFIRSLLVIALSSVFVHGARAESPPSDVQYLEAPPALRELWNKWDGKYTLFAHRSAAVKSIEDLHGKPLYGVWIEAKDMMADAVALDKAGALHMKLGFQNNPAMVKQQFAKNAQQIALVTPKGAKRLGFSTNKDLVELRFK